MTHEENDTMHTRKFVLIYSWILGWLEWRIQVDMDKNDEKSNKYEPRKPLCTCGTWLCTMTQIRTSFWILHFQGSEYGGGGIFWNIEVESRGLNIVTDYDIWKPQVHQPPLTHRRHLFTTVDGPETTSTSKSVADDSFKKTRRGR